LVIGAVESLGESTSVSGRLETGLEEEVREDWVKNLLAIADRAAGGVDTIDVYQDGRSIALSYPLDKLAPEARRVGRHIGTMELKALGGRSIQQLETWSAEDELRVSELIATENLNPKNDEDTARVISGAFGVLFKDSTKYEKVTQHLHRAFQKSYTKDPILRTDSKQRQPRRQAK
jgi:hypothetical protein